MAEFADVETRTRAQPVSEGIDHMVTQSTGASTGADTARILQLQAHVGNAAVATLLRQRNRNASGRHVHVPTRTSSTTVQRQRRPQATERPVASPTSSMSPTQTDPALTAETNSNLIVMISDARRWLDSHQRTEPLFASRLARSTQLDAERRRRIALGHVWLGANLSATPASLYRLDRRGDQVTAVSRADMTVALGAAIDLHGAEVLTPQQFQERLARDSIATAMASQLMQQAGVRTAGRASQLANVGIPNAQGGRSRRPFAIVDPSEVPPSLARTPVPSFRHPMGNIPDVLPWTAYGGPTDNAPPGARLSISDLAPSANPASPLGGSSTRVLVSYLAGRPIAAGMDQFQVSSRLQGGLRAYSGYVASTEQTGGVGRALFAERMVRALRLGAREHHLTVNPASGSRQGSSAGPGVNAVERFHAEIGRAAGSDRVYRAGDSYDLDAGQMARVALDFGADLLPAERAALQRIAEGDLGGIADLRAQAPAAAAAAQRRLQEVEFLGGLRGQGGDSIGQRAGFDFQRSLLSPFNAESAQAQQFGPAAATARAGVLGGGLGAILALPTDAAVRYATGGSFEGYSAQVPRILGSGAAAGAAGGASSQLLIGAASRSLAPEAAAMGARGGALMLGSRFVPGGIGAAAGEAVSMALDDRTHSGREVALRTGRAGGIGVVSTAVGGAAQAGTAALIGAIMSSGGVGAAGGSVAPGVGTAIGFVVGLAVGVTVYVVLDRALPTVDPTR